MRIGKRDFSPRLLPALATIVLLPILISLGFWQLDRAEQKREILRQYQQQESRGIVNLNESVLGQAYLPYQRAELTGKFDIDQQFLLDNKVYQGQAGFEVITPLLMPDSRPAILINRGWIPQSASRMKLPAVPTPSEKIKIVGLMKLDSATGFHLGDSGIDSDVWPRLVQWLDIEQMQKQLGYKLQPFVILLDPENKAGFVRDWYIKKISPEKNISYAVQWFTLALALVIIFIVVNTHKVVEAGKQDGIE
jgi:surfeit locus 1 family protein